MIKTAKQLKDKIRNLSHGNNDVAKMLIRTYFMERFLERASLSPYKDNFILKGGMLVSSIIGVGSRVTMDIDATLRTFPLNSVQVDKLVKEICAIELDDGINFAITKATTIMEDFDYPGVRVMLEGTLDKMRQAIKIDFSTDDIITPTAIKYDYKLMFEDRSISLLSYNIETLLAEKMQTVIARSIGNTRMRDFYDIYRIMSVAKTQINITTLKAAFTATCNKRETDFSENAIEQSLAALQTDNGIALLWDKFKSDNYFVGDITWQTIIDFVVKVIRGVVGAKYL